jgi:hypothetical protein
MRGRAKVGHGDPAVDESGGAVEPIALSLLYQAVHRGEMTKAEADRQLSYLRALRIRLFGDRVLQNAAWKVAGQLRPARHPLTPSTSP